MTITTTEELMAGNSFFDGEETKVFNEDKVTSVATASPETEEYTKQDFYEDLKRVSRRQNIPIGENIRDAIRSIKGK